MKKSSIGILLSISKLGDLNIIAKFLTYDFGIVSGLVKAGQSKKLKPLFQIGNLFTVEWVARLSEHLGSIKADLITGHYYLIMDDINRIELLVSMCSILGMTIIGDDNSKSIYEDTLNMIKLLSDFSLSCKTLLKDYFLYEKSIMAHLGFGFDLSKCAVTGETDISNLKYISPTTARAVSEIGGVGYEKKLLNMPEFFIKNKLTTEITKQELKYADNVLSYFIKKNIFTNQYGERLLNNRNLLINKLIEIS